MSSISFNEIPVDIRTFGQYIEFDSSRAVGQPTQTHRALIIAQRLAAGSVDAEVPTLTPSGDAAEQYFGRGSHAHLMARAFKRANPYTELWVVALDDDGAATAHTKTATVSGTATESGELVIYVAGRRIAVAVSKDDDADTIADAIDAAISEHTDLPFASSADAAVVTLTARNLGTVANNLDVRVNYNQGEALPAGVTVEIATDAEGATDPDISDAIAAIGDVHYHTIATSLADDTNLSALDTELENRWGPMTQKEGQAFAGVQGNLSSLSTKGNGHNSPFLHLVELGGASGNSPTPDFVWAAVAAAVDAFDSNLDPARPRQTLELDGVLPPEPADRFTREERQTLLTDGIATHYVDDGGTVRLERLITTYQTNAQSVPDTAYLDGTTLRTLAYLRWSWRTRLALKYPRYKLADDGTAFGPGQKVITPSLARAEALAWFSEMEEDGLVEGFEQFKADIIVERSDSDPNRLDLRMSPDLMNQFRVLAGQIQFLL